MLANIHQVKNGLSRYLDKVLRGEEVIISRYNVPIASSWQRPA
jgi:antitoxin (DNA-binding transcriptional repressor) of toxin-antitoxin stability system